MSDRRPLTPPDCDLTDFQRMMIDIPRLRGSDFDATLNDAAWRAGLNLWMSSWHQVPAASLSDDDVTLTKAAGLGRDIRSWRKVKAEALRGWVKCDDGLLYHPVVAEYALEAWLEKLLQALSSGAGNARRWGGTFDPAPVEAEIDRAAEMLRALNPKSKAIAKLQRRKSRPTSEGDPTGTPETVPVGSQGKEEGKEEGIKKEAADDSASARFSDLGREELGDLTSALREAAGDCLNAASPRLHVIAPVLALLRPGCGPAADFEQDVIPAIRATSARAKPGSVGRWEYFVPMIAEARDRRLAGAPEVGEVTPLRATGPPNDFAARDAAIRAEARRRVLNG